MAKNTPSITEKKGAMLENIVAIHLRRLGKEFYYYKGKTNAETDFVIPADREAIQVCYELNGDNERRETVGLLEAVRGTKATKLMILTLEQEREIDLQNKKITVKPVWQWLLENEPAAGTRS
jgi:predicted AAA+ superfamily ATPase